MTLKRHPLSALTLGPRQVILDVVIHSLVLSPGSGQFWDYSSDLFCVSMDYISHYLSSLYFQILHYMYDYLIDVDRKRAYTSQEHQA